MKLANKTPALNQYHPQPIIGVSYLLARTTHPSPHARQDTLQANDMLRRTLSRALRGSPAGVWLASP